MRWKTAIAAAGAFVAAGLFSGLLAAPSLAFVEGVLVGNGDKITAAIGEVGDEDSFTLGAGEGGKISVTVGAAKGSLVLPVLQLFDPSGDEADLSLLLKGVGGKKVSFKNFVVPAGKTGEWTVRVSGSVTAGGYAAAFKVADPKTVVRRGLVVPEGQEVAVVFPTAAGAVVTGKVKVVSGTAPVAALFRADAAAGGGSALVLPAFTASRAAAADLPVESRTRQASAVALAKAGGAGECVLDITLKVKVPKLLKRKAILAPEGELSSATPGTVRQEGTPVLALAGVLLQGEASPRVFATLPGTDVADASVAVTASAFTGAPTTDVPSGVVLSPTGTATFAVAADAAFGDRDLVYVPPPLLGEPFRLPAALTVEAPVPTVTSVSPASVRQEGSSILLTVTGTGFRAGGSLSFSGTGISAGATTVVDATTATVSVTIDGAATVGARDVTFTQPAAGGSSTGTGTGVLTVKNPVPTLTAASPATIRQDDAGVVVTFTGTGFRGGGTLSVSGTGITVGTTTVVNATTVTAALTVASNATTGLRSATWTQPVAGGGDAATATDVLTVNFPNPAVTSASPDTVPQEGSSILVTVTGTGFRAGGTLTISGTGLTLGSTSVVNATTATVSVSVDAAATVGARDVTFTQAAGGGGAAGSKTGALTVLHPVPTVTAVSPTSVRQEGSSIGLTVTGTGFRPGGTLTISGTGLTLGGTSVTNATTATVSVSVDAAATVGTRDVTFTQPSAGGASTGTGTGILTVKNPLPTMSSASPSAIRQEDTGVTVTFTGTGFRSGGTLTISGTGITVGTTTVVNATTVTAALTVASNATTGLRSATWTQPAAGGGDAVTATDVLTVNFPTPTVTSASPNSLRQLDSASTVTVTGTGFRTGGTLTISGTGLTLGSTTVVNATTATVAVTVDEFATVGARDVVFTQAAGGGGASGTGTGALTVKNPLPTLTSFTPTTVVQGTSNVTVVLTGQRFRDGGVVSAGSGMTFTGGTRDSDTQFTVTLAVDAAASLGLRDLVYTQPASGGGDSATKSNSLQVNAPTPTVTAIDVGTLKQNDSALARFVTGTNFRSGGSLSVSGAGVSVGSVVVTSATRVDFTLTATNGAAIGARDITWTQPVSGGGATGTLSSGLTVLFPDPTFTAVSPTTIDREASNLMLTLTGTNFRAGGTVSVSGTEVTLSSPTWVSDTSFTVLASVTATASLGFRNLTYQHTGGGGASATKTSAVEILPVGVELTSLSPSAWSPGLSRFRVVAAGANFNSGTSVSVSGSGVTVHSTTVDSAVKLTLDVSVASNAALGSRNVTVTPGAGGGSAKTFNGAATIAATAPTIGSFSAPTLAQGASGFAVTILGSGFRSGDTVAASGSGVTFASVTVVNEGKITANATVTGGASIGLRDLTVSHSAANGGQSATLASAFKVIAAAPTVTAVNPSKVGRTGSGGVTREVPITLTGTNFMTGATLAVSRTSSSGVSVVSSSEAVISDTQMSATLAVTGTATTGLWNLVVSNPSSLGNSGSSGNNLLDVKDENTLCVHRVNAASGSAFGGERVTITGSGFVAGAVVDFGTVRAPGTQVLDKCTLVTTVPAPSAQSTTAVRVVDVKVTNPSTANVTLTNGYAYAKDDGEFKVVSIFPAQGATGVPGNLVSAVVRLSYPANTSSGTYGTTTGTNSFWFRSGGSFVTSGSRGFGPGGKYFVFTRPTGSTLTTGTYVLDLPVTLTSLGGSPLSPQRITSITHDQYNFGVVSGTTDSTAPTLSNLTPANGATGVDLGTKVRIVLSEEIDPLTVTSSNITFKQGSTTIGADLALETDLRTVTITPHATLAASTTYTTNVTASVTDLCGNAYANTSYTFTTGTGGDSTNPVIDAVIVESIPSDMDGSGTFVNNAGTGGNAFDLYLPQDGWLVDVRFSDEGVGIDPSTFSAKASVAVAGNSANAELASNFTVTSTGATWRIPASGFATGEDDTFTFLVKDLSGNTSSSRVITFDVVSKDSTSTNGGDLEPFDARRTVILRGDIDAYTATYSTSTGPNQQGATTTVSASGVPDLDEALRLVGLNTGSMTADAAATVRGNDTGTNAILRRLFMERLRELMRVRYGISEDGVHGADSANVEFLLAGEQGSLGSMPTFSASNAFNSSNAYSELSIGGTLGADGSAFSAAGTLGQAWIDPRNTREEANLNFGVGGSTTGIYLMGMMKLQVNNSTTNSIFGSRISARFVAIHGGTPAGEGSLDDDVLAGSFDRTAGGNTAAMNTRYDQIMDAVELVALYTSAVAAHEVGHSTGVAANNGSGTGNPKTGLFGNAHFNNTFTEATSGNPNTSFHLDFIGNDIMAASTSFETGVVTGADFKRFSPMDFAYLRNRLVYDEAK